MSSRNESGSKNIFVSPNRLDNFGIHVKHDGKKRSAFELLSFNNIKFEDLIKVWPKLSYISNDSKQQIEIESRYKEYLIRQQDDINDFKKDEQLLLPSDIDYSKVASLSKEVIEKLSKVNPPTLGTAARISGVNPAAIVSLLRYVKKGKNSKAA